MKTAFMFSGQGSQYASMGKELFDNCPQYKEVFQLADESLGFKISEICFNGGSDLDKTEYTQPAMLTIGIASYMLLKNKNIQPDYCLGLSLGEYSALVASEALDFSQTVQLVRKRGKFMTEACPEGVGAMSAVMGLSRPLLLETLEEASANGYVSAANFNMPDQIVIAGEVNAVSFAEKIALEKGAKRCIRLNVGGAFHTKMMEPASKKLNIELLKMEIKEMKTPVISNLTGDFIHKKEDIVPTLTKQVMRSVMWEDSILRLLDLGVTRFIELGCGKTTINFVKKIAKTNNENIEICNIEDLESYENTLRIIEGLGD